MDFINTIHSSIVARIIAGEIGLPQTVRCRKGTKDEIKLKKERMAKKRAKTDKKAVTR